MNSVVIIGCARDVAKHLPFVFEKIEMIKSLFKESKVIIYENDSKDDTLNLLKSNPLIEVISEKNVEGPRTVRLARGRNILMKRALDYNYEYIVNMDMDEVNRDLTKEGFLSSFDDEKFPDWACVAANQSVSYYDLWTIRTYDDWVPFDIYAKHRETGDIDFCREKRRRYIPENADPVKVKACFGGLAIYKTRCIGDSKYNGLREDGYEQCCHVSFCEGLKGDIYINPKMINCPGDHCM